MIKKLRLFYQQLVGKKTKIGAAIYFAAMGLKRLFPELSWLEIVQQAAEFLMGGGTLDALARWFIKRRKNKAQADVVGKKGK
jgi:hypothetical protein